MAREEGRYRVLKGFPPSISGNRFSESLLLKDGDDRILYLLAYREDEPTLQVGQILPALPAESRLYKCRITLDEVPRKPLEEGDEK